MKRRIVQLVSTLCVACLLCGCDGGVGEVKKKDVLTDDAAVRVMSFNVCGWNYKELKHLAAKTILTYDPDTVGLQECSYDCYKDLMKDLSEYSFVGVGRDTGDLSKKSGESCGILYKTEKYTLVDSGTFWLSETPDEPSLGWDADYIRVCTWAILKDRVTGEEFAHVNTHLENIDDGSGMEALKNGTQMVVDKALSFDMPVVMTGDYNFEKETEYYNTVIAAGFRDTQDVAENTMDGDTFHGFDPADPPEHIDYIFINDGIAAVYTYKLVEDTFAGQYPSDHYPIYADVRF